MKKHLFILTKASRAAAYGIGTYLHQLESFLNDVSDWTVTVLELRSDVADFVMETKDRIRYVKIPNKINAFRLEKEEQSVLYLRASMTILKTRLSFDKDDRIVFLLNYIYRECYSIVLRDIFPACKIVSVIHYIDWMFTLEGNTTRFKRIVGGRLDELTDGMEKSVWESFQYDSAFFRSVDHIISMADYTRNLLIDTYRIAPASISLVYNGIKDAYKETPVEYQRELKVKYGLNPDETVLLFVGRLDVAKGLSYLLTAFKELLKSMPGCRLLIAGEGDYATFIPKASAIWSKVSWLGKVDKEELFDLYRLADVGMIPTMNEQCSYVAIEMMMSGLPLIGTTSTGLNEMIPDNRYKVNLKEEDDQLVFPVEQLADKLVGFLRQDTACREIYGKQLRSIYHEKYDIQIMKQHFMSVLSGLFIN